MPNGGIPGNTIYSLRYVGRQALGHISFPNELLLLMIDSPKSSSQNKFTDLSELTAVSQA